MTDTPAGGTGDPTDPTQPERLEPPAAPTQPAADVPPTPTAETTATAAPTQEAPVTAVPAEGATTTTTTTTPPTRRKGVMVPWWALAVVAALVVFGGGFLIGHAVGDDGHGDREVRIANPFGNGNGNPFAGNGNGLPNPFGGNGNGNGGNENGNGRNGNGNGSGGNGSANATPAFLGVGVATSSDPAGVRVTTVVASGPASGAGLKQGDVITAIDGTAVKTEAALRKAIAAHNPGDDVKVTYTRDGAEKTVTVSLGDRDSIAQ